MMVMALIMPLISCATTKTVEIETVYVPELVFPIFPELKEYEKLNNGVLVSNEYILELSKYKILINETEKTYNDIKSLYEED